MNCLGVQISKNMIELSVQIRREGQDKLRKLRQINLATYLLFAFITGVVISLSIFYFFVQVTGKFRNYFTKLPFGNSVCSIIVSSVYGVVTVAMLIAFFYM